MIGGAEERHTCRYVIRSPVGAGWCVAWSPSSHFPRGKLAQPSNGSGLLPVAAVIHPPGMRCSLLPCPDSLACASAPLLTCFWPCASPSCASWAAETRKHGQRNAQEARGCRRWCLRKDVLAHRLLQGHVPGGAPGLHPTLLAVCAVALSAATALQHWCSHCWLSARHAANLDLCTSALCNLQRCTFPPCLRTT